MSPLLANIALDGIEKVHTAIDIYGRRTNPSIRYADDMVIILRPQDNPKEILEGISQFLANRGMKISEKKTKITATTDGFDFLGWHFLVQSNGKFRCTPSVENFKKFRQKVKAIVRCSNYGAKVKADKLAPIVRGWRNYHRHCKMDGSRFSLWRMNHRTYNVFMKEKKLNHLLAEKLIKKAFPSVSYSKNKFVNVKENKSPYDGDIAYWSQRNSKLYDDVRFCCKKYLK